MEVVSIQYLRGIAALAVVLFHLELQLDRVGYQGYWPHFLDRGVDIFFVISGFIMWITTLKGMTTLEFYRRRFLRIAPLYWLLTSVVLVTLVTHPSSVQSGRFDTWHVIGSYLFFPLVHPVEGVMHPLLSPGWTLNYEMFFYAIFGLGLFLPTLPRLIVVSTVLCGLASVPLLTGPMLPTAAQFYTSGIIIEFSFGIALGWLYSGGARFSARFAWPCFLIGVAAIASVGGDMPYRGLSVGVPALLVVAGAIMIERLHGLPNIHSLHLLGNASYSVYLSHTIVLSAVGQLWRRLPFDLLPGALAVFACTAAASAIGAGIIIYLYIEVPMLRIGRLRILKTGLQQVRTPILPAKPIARARSDVA
jgi:exopolysaccharide production protein ExoZ